MLITPIYLVVLFVVMTGFQYIYAERNELDKQKDYIDENIKSTRSAYNIEIDEKNIDKRILINVATTQNTTNFVSQRSLKLDCDTSTNNNNGNDTLKTNAFNLDASTSSNTLILFKK